ncbi:MAG: DUF340 domain-containing protein [Bacteroidetes bacterium]|uniref:DUF340 domain-containing protein n=1 Tax=Candidatus Limisoma faecipullorum TaxID=2840854 RepID=A0A9D9IP39_9BACT|nr:DUF340 domain-containing protein [Candidatus Limisoma faecipullorum]
MLVILSLLFGSIATGYACKNIKMVKSFSGMVSLTVLLLLLTLGISVGMQDAIVGNLLNLGIIAFAIAASCVAGSVLLTYCISLIAERRRK